MCSTFVGILIAVLFSICVIVYGIIKHGDYFFAKYDWLIAIVIVYSMFILVLGGMLATCYSKSFIVKQSLIQSVYSNDFATIKVNDGRNTYLNYSDARDINLIKTGKFEVINEIDFNHYGGTTSLTYKLKAK